MKTRIGRLTALILMMGAALTVAHAKRLLLPPPDGYKGVEINGTKYVVGQVYVPQFSDTNKLKDYGFRGFEAIGSTSRYRKVKAVWPLDTDLDALPEWITGLSYEKAKSVEDMQRAYAVDKNIPQNVESIGTLMTIYGDQYNNYGGRMYITERYQPPGGPNYRLDNYGFYNDGSRSSRSFNDCGAYYRTRTPTKLTPTTIGVYGGRRTTRFGRYYCR